MSGLPESLLSERGQSAGYFQTELDTRGAAFLAAAGIPFTGIQYFPDRDTSETVSAEHGAAKPKTRAFTDRAGVSEHHIIKTLVFSDSKHTQAFVVLMHGDCRVNTKALSKQIDVKKIVQAPIDVAQDWSGYIMGGTSPFGLRKPMQVFIEKSILEIPGKIIINAGRHDSYHLMSPSDIVAAFNTKHAADAGFGPIREVQCGEVRVPAAAAPESPSAGSPAGDAAASTAGEAALAAAAAAAPAAAAHAAAVPAAAAPVAATGLPASVTTFAALADAVDRTLSELQVLSSMYAHTNVDPDTYTAADAGAAASSSPIDTSGLDVAVADPASVAQLLALRDAFAAKKKAALPTGTDAAAAAAAAGVMWPALSLTVTDSFDDPRGLAAAAGLSSASFRLAIDLPAGYPFVAAAPRPAVAAGTAVVLRARLAAVAEKHCAAGASEAVYDLIETCKAHFALDTLTAPAPAAAAASAAAVGGVAGSAVARAAAGGVLDPASVMVTPLVVMPKGGVITGAAATVAAGGKPQPGPDGRLHLFRPATAPEGLTQAQLIGTGVRCLATGRASVSGGDEDFAVTYQSLRGRLVVGEKGRPKTVLQLSSPLALVPSPEHIKWLGKPKTKIRMGFVGMPNVGKSSLFNLMSGMQVPAENYAFCTIEPNIAKVPIRDPRAELVAAAALRRGGDPSFATVDVIDIAGLVKGASLGYGLGNAFLHHISTVHVIFQVVRAFDDLDVVHVEGAVDPVRDIAIITAELIAKDLEEMCKRLERLTSKLYRSMTLAQSAQQSRELAILLKAYEWLVSGHCLRHCVWTEAEHAFLSTLQMWTSKPTCFLVNMSARDYADPAARAAQCAAVLAWTAEHSPDSAVVPISVRYEQAALQCPPEASTAFVTDVAERIVAVAAAAAAERAAKASADSAAKNKVDKKDKKDKKEVRSLVEGSSKGSSKGSNKGSEKNDKKDKKDKKESSSSRKSSLGGTDKPAATAGAAAAEDNPDALAASAAAAAAAAAAAVGADAIPTAAPAVPRNEIASLCTLAERPPAAARAPWGAAAWACALGTVWLQPAPSPEPTAAVSAQAAGASAGASRPVGGHGAVDVEDHDVTHAAARGLKPSASSALYGLIDAGYNAWSMVRVYLIDGDRAEVKAFLVRRGTEAQAVSALLYYDNPQHCTGVHVYPWDAFVRAGHSLDQMRKNNTRLVKTRTYPVQEGDILQFVIKPE